MKTCCRCKATKPVEEFNKDAARKEGLRSDCRACHNEANRKSMRKWREANPGAARERERKWRQENPEAKREIARKANHKWHEANPEPRRAACAARRAMKLRAIPLWGYLGDTEGDQRAMRVAHHASIEAGVKSMVPFTTQDYRGLLVWAEVEKQIVQLLLGVPCALDHHIPLSKGGLHCPLTNLNPMTAASNLRKTDKMPGVDWFPPKNVYQQVTYQTQRGSRT